MISTKLEYKFEDTKDNFKILRINKQNKWIYVGSKYNMNSEINKFLNNIEEAEIDKKKSIIIIFGFGTGDHIKAVREKYKENEIIVFEPNFNLHEYIEEFKSNNKDSKLKIYCDENIEVKEMLEGKLNQMNFMQAKVVWFANYYKIYDEEINAFLNQLKSIFYDIKLDLNTSMHLSEKGFLSLMDNLQYIAQGIPADLYENKYENKPCVIVSAGPSLGKNIDYLKEVNDDMIILSGGRTLRSLIDKQITPHLLAVVDSNEVSYELCKGYIENLNRPLLFFEESSEKVAANHKGKKLFFTYNDEIRKIADHNVKPLITGGSVAHIMTSYAVMLGCNPIIFIGQDLAYTGEKSHAKIADNRDNTDWFKVLKADDDIYVEDINGGKVRTSLTLNKYRTALEDIIKANSNITFINATEGGARIKGTIEMTLKEAMDKYKKESFHIFEDIEYNVDIKKNALKSLLNTKKTANEIVKLYKKSLTLIEKLEKYKTIKNSSYVNQILNELNTIDENAKVKFEKMDLIRSLTFPIIYNVLSRRTSDFDSQSDDSQIYKENKEFYSSLIEVLKYAEKHIEYIIKKLS